MDFTDIMKQLNNASLYDLFRIRMIIENIEEDPARIKVVRQCFAVGDTISYFNGTANSLIEAIVLDKKSKSVLVKNIGDGRIWSLRYYMINLEGKESDIRTHGREKLTKNHLKIGDLVGFNHDGEQLTGSVIKLNSKTVSLLTSANKRWRVSYGLLFKVLEGETIIEEGMTLITTHMPSSQYDPQS